MTISNYIKMNYDELAQEIAKQKKKIDSAKETIKLLEKLQIAEMAKQQHKSSAPENHAFGEDHGSI